MKHTLFLLLFLLSSACAMGQAKISAELKSGTNAGEWIVTIALDNEQEFVAMQADVDLPDSVTATKVLKSERMQAQTVLSNRMKNGKLRILAYNMTSKPILGNSGTLFTVMVKAPEWPEDKTFSLSNIHLTSPGSKDNALPNTEIKR